MCELSKRVRLILIDIVEQMFKNEIKMLSGKRRFDIIIFFGVVKSIRFD